MLHEWSTDSLESFNDSLASLSGDSSLDVASARRLLHAIDVAEEERRTRRERLVKPTFYRCDGPCRKMIKNEDLVQLGRCDHSGCRKCFNEANVFECPNTRCVLINRVAEVRDPESRKKAIREWIDHKSSRTLLESSEESRETPPQPMLVSVQYAIVDSCRKRLIKDLSATEFISHEPAADIFEQYNQDYLSDEYKEKKYAFFYVPGRFNDFPDPTKWIRLSKDELRAPIGKLAPNDEVFIIMEIADRKKSPHKV